MSQTFNATNSGSSAAVADALLVNTNTLRSAFSGSSAPGSPVQGQLWLDTSAASYVLKVYADLEGTGAAWYVVGSIGAGALDLKNNQMVNVRLENVTSETTPAAGVIGEVYLHTTNAKARVIVSATVREIIWSASNVDYQRVELPATAWDRDATNPPTAATKGTTPTCRGWLFDAANELASIAVRVPAGYSADADLKLRLFCVLNQAGTPSDDIDWTLDLVSVTPSSADVLSQTSTQATVTKDLGATVADGSWHVCDLTIDYDDANNPVAAGDLLFLQIHRTDLANCGGVIFVGAQLLVPSGQKATE